MGGRGLPTGRFRRLTRPALMGAAGVAAGAATWARGLARSTDLREELRSERAIRTAEQAVAVMGEMKGVVMKLGQMLSFADLPLIPPEMQAVLAQLQADAPPMAWELVEQVVTAELGDHPDRLFARFSRVPMAAASIGQVHSARLHDGTDVAVKVQYPEVADAMEADLRNTEMLTTLVNIGKTFAGPMAPAIDVKGLVAELRDGLADELDYRTEAAHQERFAEIWTGDPSVRIPRVVPPLSTRRVLTQEYHDGMRWSAALECDQRLRDQWGRSIFRFVFVSLYRHRIFNADPHPGNYLFHEDGTVSFLDFGCVRSFDETAVSTLRHMAWAAIDRDADAFVQAMVDGGWYPRPPKADPRTILDMGLPAWAPLVEAQPFRFTPEWAAANLQTQLAGVARAKQVVREVAFPPEQLFLARISLGLFSVLAGLRASGEWLELYATGINPRPSPL